MHRQGDLCVKNGFRENLKRILALRWIVIKKNPVRRVFTSPETKSRRVGFTTVTCDAEGYMFGATYGNRLIVRGILGTTQLGAGPEAVGDRRRQGQRYARSN